MMARGSNPWHRVRTRTDRLDPERFAHAVAARRMDAFGYALVTWIVGFSLDDLAVLRVPAYLLGIAGALAWFAFGPLALGRRFARRHEGLDTAGFEARLGQTRRRSALRLLGSILAFIVWFAFFSEGVPAWAV